VNTSVSLLAFLLVPSLTCARPVIIEETQRLETPNAALTYFAESVAIDGDWALASALRSDDGSYNYPYRQLALLYHRTGGVWRFERTLVDDGTDETSWNHPSVAMRNGIAAVSTSPLRTFRLVDGVWTATPAPFPAPAGSETWANGFTRVSGNTLVSIAGRCNYGAVTANHAAGTWSAPQAVSGNARICSIANYASSVDVDGNTLAVTNPQEDESFPPTALRLYSRTAPTAPWQLDTTLATGDWGRGIALRGDELLVTGWSPYGTEIFRRNAGVWEPAGHLPTPSGFTSYYDGAFHIARNEEFVVQGASMREDLRGAIAVYRRDAGGEYQRVALLTSSTGDALGPVVDISGRTVVVSARGDSFDQGRLYFFELPEDFTTPAVLQDDFEDGNSASWQTSGGEFTVARRGVTRILRQSNLAGMGVAVFTPSQGTSQSFTVDIRPTAFSGNDRWFGVATRYTDADNYYYVTLRSSGSVQLRRMREGEFTTLATREMPVAVNGNYRVRLESVGSRHRVFINDNRVLEAFDGALEGGRAALLTYRTAADFDNILVTPGPRTTLYDSDIVNASECRALITEPELRVAGAPQWDCTVYTAPYLRQTSSSGPTRAAVGPVADDQVVESRVLAEAFAANGNTPKWLGVMTRYTDERNFYYLALRSSDTVVLGAVVDGVSTELDVVTYSVNPGAWYALRLEVVGTKLRGYVNGVLRVEANDSRHARGISGIATEKTAARFDYFRVHQP
jgi:hypothetical protein